MNGIERAKKVYGSYAKLGKHLGGLSGEAVRKWSLGENQIPAERVFQVYRATKGEVTPHDLRPDLYPNPSWLPGLEPGVDDAA